MEHKISQGEDPFSTPQSTLQEGAGHYGCLHGIAYCEIYDLIPKTRGGVKHYSPGEIMTDCCSNASNLKLSFGVYCQVAENVEPRNSLAPRTRAAISLGNSCNLPDGQMFLALDTGHNINRYQWVLLPMPPTVIT